MAGEPRCDLGGERYDSRCRAIAWAEPVPAQSKSLSSLSMLSVHFSPHPLIKHYISTRKHLTTYPLRNTSLNRYVNLQSIFTRKPCMFLLIAFRHRIVNLIILT